MIDQNVRDVIESTKNKELLYPIIVDGMPELPKILHESGYALITGKNDKSKRIVLNYLIQSFLYKAKSHAADERYGLLYAEINYSFPNGWHTIKNLATVESFIEEKYGDNKDATIYDLRNKIVLTIEDVNFKMNERPRGILKDCLNFRASRRFRPVIFTTELTDWEDFCDIDRSDMLEIVVK